MTRVRLQVGATAVDFDVEERYQVMGRVKSAPRPLADVRAATRAALEQPLGFPPLRTALTPDDHVAIVVDESLGRLPEVLEALLDHLSEAAVAAERITFLCPPRRAGAPIIPWRDTLPARFAAAGVEVHDPADRTKLAYLAATKAGRAVYLNRTVVDADQVIVVGSLRYDAALGYGGELADLFPALSDEATRGEWSRLPGAIVPAGKSSRLREEIEEVAWLLGVPFLLLAIPAVGDELSALTGGLTGEAFPAAKQRLDEAWSLRVPQSAELVVAALAGAAATHTFAHVADAFLQASRVVQPGGRIVVLSQMQAAQLGDDAALLRGAESFVAALAEARKDKHADAAALWNLATAAQRGTLHLLADMPREAVEDLNLIALDRPEQVERLIHDAVSYLFLQDAHRMRTRVEG
jgi:nickel-dependent lactate racemase